MFVGRYTRTMVLTVTLLMFVGCGETSSKPTLPATSNATRVHTDDADHPAHNDAGQNEGDAHHGHSHERGKMMIADAGPIHALLTAHLAAAGNELDIFLETPDATHPQPVTIDAASFQAQATAGEGESQTLIFDPAPADDRPAGETAGKCSHFIAKAPWMKPEDDLLIVAKFSVDGKQVVARWKKFIPNKYAHHVE